MKTKELMTYNHEVFVQFIESKKAELQEIQDFIQRAIKNPNLFFTESNIYLKSPHNLFSMALGSFDKLNNTSFHVFISDYLTRVLNEWCIRNNLTDNYHIKVHNTQTYPSVFAVCLDKTELIQFDIFEKWYGIRDNPELKVVSADKNIDKYEIDLLNRILKTKQEEIVLFNKMKKNNWLLFKRYGLFKCIFEYKTVQKMLVEDLNFVQSVEKNVKIQIEKLTIPPVNLNDYYLGLSEHINHLKSFFESFDYIVETNTHKMY